VAKEPVLRSMGRRRGTGWVGSMKETCRMGQLLTKVWIVAKSYDPGWMC
jgi:hypothetical protein